MASVEFGISKHFGGGIKDVQHKIAFKAACFRVKGETGVNGFVGLNGFRLTDHYSWDFRKGRPDTLRFIFVTFNQANDFVSDRINDVVENIGIVKHGIIFRLCEIKVFAETIS